MKVPVVKVGNSRGIRIPKVVIEECGFGSEVNLEVRKDSIVLRPVQGIRSGWAESFKKMAESGDDNLLDEDFASDWDKKDWEWK
jgi:antitoxin MazE